jgi:hypothetical protein
LEVGYVGRILRNEYQAIDLSSVPFMTTLGGETFANAFTNLFNALCGQNTAVDKCANNPASSVPVQAFFESAFAMPANAPGAILQNGNWVSNFCSTNGATSCTTAVAANQGGNIKNANVFNTWALLPMTFGAATTLNSKGVPVGIPTVYSQNQLNSIFMETSMGWGNYNGAIVSFTARDWHGVTARSNFTWSHPLGTGDTTQATTQPASPILLTFAMGMDRNRLITGSYTTCHFSTSPHISRGTTGSSVTCSADGRLLRCSPLIAALPFSSATTMRTVSRHGEKSRVPRDLALPARTPS